jgi:hypothetical protein
MPDNSCEDVMIRIEKSEGTKEGNMLIKGTILIDGDYILRTSFDTTTSVALLKHMQTMKYICNNFVRSLNMKDSVEYVRADYRERYRKKVRYQIVMAIENEFKAVAIQEYKLRNLRERSTRDQKDIRGYQYNQQNYFFPSMDKN